MKNKESGTFRPIFLVLCHKFLQHQRLSAKLYIIHVEPCLLPSSARWSLTTTTNRGVSVSHECVVLLLAVSWLCVISTQYKKIQRDSTRWICAMKWDEIIFLKCPSFCFTTAAVSLQQAHETHINSSINCYESSFIYIKGFTVFSFCIFFYIFHFMFYYIAPNARTTLAHDTSPLLGQ